MAGDGVFAFLDAIDAELARHAAEGEMLELYLIGRAALIAGYGVGLMTKDVDVVQTASSRRSPLFALAADLFQRGGPEHARLGFYLEVVSSGLPPVPSGFEQRCLDVPGPWRVIRPKRPEAHDLIVTKLKRFHGGDREDVRILCDTERIDVGTLRERFELAHLWSDPDDPRIVAARANLEVVVEYLAGKRRSL